MRLPPRLLGALLAGGHVGSPLEDRLEQATPRRRNHAESGPQLVATSGRMGQRAGRRRLVPETGCVPNLFCANLASKSRLSHRPATRSAVEIGTWLQSLGLGDSTALAARLDAGDLRLGVAGGLVGIGDAIGASAAQQGGVVDGVPAKPAVPEAAMVR